MQRSQPATIKILVAQHVSEIEGVSIVLKATNTPYYRSFFKYGGVKLLWFGLLA